MSPVKKKKRQRELRGRGEFNLFITREDDGVLLGGDSVKEILWCHHSNEMSLAGLKMEFRFRIRLWRAKGFIIPTI